MLALLNHLKHLKQTGPYVNRHRIVFSADRVKIKPKVKKVEDVKIDIRCFVCELSPLEEAVGFEKDPLFYPDKTLAVLYDPEISCEQAQLLLKSKNE